MPAEPPAPVLRFSVASIESPRDTFSTYTRLFDRVGQILDARVEFVQRRTYREVNDLLASGQLDVALVCTGGYLDLEKRAPGATEVLAVPVLDGEESYRALVIVPASSDIKSVDELRARRFAFTDELSLSGRLYALRLLRDKGLDPEHFFGPITYTGSHDRSVEAVARGLVDGAAVHGHVLEHMESRDPSLARRIRVVHRSPPFGSMPVVVSRRLPAARREQIRRVLLELDRDPVGAAALRMLHFDRFAEPIPALYSELARLVDAR